MNCVCGFTFGCEICEPPIARERFFTHTDIRVAIEHTYAIPDEFEKVFRENWQELLA